MTRATGVSVKAMGESRYKLRWRERTPEGGWRSRSETLEGSRLERWKERLARNDTPRSWEVLAALDALPAR